MKDYKKLLTDFFTKYNPEKISDVPDLLIKYSGQEEELLNKLYIKYNVNQEVLKDETANQTFSDNDKNPKIIATSNQNKSDTQTFIPEMKPHKNILRNVIIGFVTLGILLVAAYFIKNSLTEKKLSGVYEYISPTGEIKSLTFLTDSTAIGNNDGQTFNLKYRIEKKFIVFTVIEHPEIGAQTIEITNEGLKNSAGEIFVKKSNINGPKIGGDSLNKNSVMIGKQEWMVKNLNVSKFRNGDIIPEAKSESEWIAANDNQKPAWCYYNNNPDNGDRYGKLYNWYAVNDSRGIAPIGWHVPSPDEWTRLKDFLGGSGCGTKMKSNSYWTNNGSGTNESGFSGLPGGARSASDGKFVNLGAEGSWWSNSRVIEAVDPDVENLKGVKKSSNDSVVSVEETTTAPTASYYYDLLYNESELLKGDKSFGLGFSVRLVKDI